MKDQSILRRSGFRRDRSPGKPKFISAMNSGFRGLTNTERSELKPLTKIAPQERLSPRHPVARRQRKRNRIKALLTRNSS